MEKLSELIEQLDYYWNYFGDDPYDKGEHSKCSEIQEQMIDILNEQDDETLIEFCENIEPEKLEQFAYPLDEVSNNHPCVEPYIQY